LVGWLVGWLVLIVTLQYRLIRTVSLHYDKVTALDWSADGKYLVSGSKDMSLRLFALRGEVQPVTLTGHRDFIVDCSFGKDNSTVCLILHLHLASARLISDAFGLIDVADLLDRTRWSRYGLEVDSTRRGRDGRASAQICTKEAQALLVIGRWQMGHPTAQIPQTGPCMMW
jgi:hypothetical protein